MAAYQKISGELDRCKLILYYERELLAKYGGLCDGMFILYTYKYSKERYEIQKNNINKAYIQGIKNVYGKIKNVAVLHTIDKAIDLIDSSLKILDECFVTFKSVLPEGEFIQVTPEGDMINHKLD
jgi:hypothetical protein